MSLTFAHFFANATGNVQGPYPYQERFATEPILPHLLRAPTGAGKTATAVLGWLWRYLHSHFPTPRRLAYCLPMRVLVEQSFNESEKWLRNLGLSEKVGLHLLMGGAEKTEWYLYPEKPTILIGTQDMLLSRALNRGYAATRFHWPIDFGLLNNDCLWVFDEPQLMANGVSTSAQLAGLRKSLETFGTCPSVWMSATLEPSWLDTIDFRGKFNAPRLELQAEDYDPKLPLLKRMTASKILAKLEGSSTKDMKEVAKGVVTRHVAGTQTLVVVNTVDRAKALYEELLKARKKNEKPRLLLVHSRFRPLERAELNRLLQEKGEITQDRIIVATQVVEAGVDISSRTLISELAPWASIVQRIGRCNRTGDDGPSKVYWIDLDEKSANPYEWNHLLFARKLLVELEGEDVSPKNLDDLKKAKGIELPFEHKHILRRRDLLDLFDTSPDLSGNDIDIQRFVRSDDPDIDVKVFWRGIPKEGPSDQEPSPTREELCSVPVGSARNFLETLKEKKRGEAYVWDHLDEKWIEIEPKQVRPGLTILLPNTVGGYSELGWDAASTNPVEPVGIEEAEQEESTGSDPLSASSVALTIQQHTQNVVEMLGTVQVPEVLPEEWHAHLNQAAIWHDVGKAHWAFQAGMLRANAKLNDSQLWAKSGQKVPLRHGRKYFRHELASALAVLLQGLPFEVAYLIASHHGKVRLAIRSLPGEDAPRNPETLFALGVHHDDELPEVDLGEAKSPKLRLDLSPMRLGGESSWTGHALNLREKTGLFRLAYLEAILRAADVRASKKEAGE